MSAHSFGQCDITNSRNIDILGGNSDIESKWQGEDFVLYCIVTEFQ